jgi:trigger factor
VMKAILTATSIELPGQLVGMEIDRLREAARQDWKNRTGQDTSGIDLPANLFEEQARRRVALGLILTELVQREKLEARPEQVRALLEEQAQSYEQPEEMVRWYYEDAERLREVESVVLEDNVVTWALTRAKVMDRQMPFQELIGQAG